ncbi:hypothetical protein [Leptospira stimsonii]|uniref:hypothetical protein n=1 Tax=Leptospira stimsonii TaxID=2202203 RepID=UPI0019D4F839|nr:hypothetical protein [Leptospira stimsonii]
MSKVLFFRGLGFLLSVTQTTAPNCLSLIFSTKGHPTSEDLDTDLFLDVDLSILG